MTKTPNCSRRQATEDFTEIVFDQDLRANRIPTLLKTQYDFALKALVRKLSRGQVVGIGEISSDKDYLSDT
jgi:hypothetical protein